MAQTRQQNQRPIKIMLEKALLIAEGDDFNVEVFARLELNRQPLQGEALVVYVNRRQWGEQQTDIAGRVFWRLEGIRKNGCLRLNEKQVIVEVMCRATDGSFGRAQQNLSIDKASTAIDPVTGKPAKEKPKLTKLKAYPSGQHGKYHIKLVALDQNGHAFHCGTIEWSCGDTLSGVENPSNGLASHLLTLEEPGEYTYLAQAVGTKVVSEAIKLNGPKQKPEIPAEDRFKLGVHDQLDAPKFEAVIPVEKVLTKLGEPYAGKIEAYVLSGMGVVFRNARNNAVLAEDAKYCEFEANPDGTYRLAVVFKGQFEIRLRLRHPDSGQEWILKLVYKQR